MNKSILNSLLSIIFLVIGLVSTYAQGNHETTHEDEKSHHELLQEERSYNHKVIHHIADANHFHIFGNIALPLPVILYDYEDGLLFMMSSVFEHGHKAVDGYVMDRGEVKKMLGDAAPEETKGVKGFKDGEEGERYVILDNNKSYKIQESATLINLGKATFIDFSITKTVFTMLLAAIILIIILFSVRKGFKRNEGKAPKGIQSLMEPFILFVRDEIAKPAIGPGWEKYFPLVATLFFFILINNILGLVPFFPGGGNVMGNTGVTLALALITFITVNLSGKKYYWQHVFWMPGVPVAVKPILAVIEFLGLFTKPFTLFIRLFANISAGHIVILSLVGMIFILGNNGESLIGASVGGLIAVPFVFMMFLLELLVGIIQAFIFALLTALYIGDAIATEDAH